MSYKKKLKIIFAGTPNFAACHLNALLFSKKYDVICVLTQPDRPAGRGNKITSSPVKIITQAHNIQLFQPNTLKSKENQQLLAKLQADVIVVVAYGLILPEKVLQIPTLGCINVHCSLLPRWRGAAPIQRSILSGDFKTGITIIKMDAGLDTGNILNKIICPISTEETSASLYNKLSSLGPKIMLTTLDQLESNNFKIEIQDETLVTYAKKINKKEALIDWSLSALQLERCVRAFNPWPVSYFMMDGEQIKIWQATALPYKDKIEPGKIIQADKNGIKVITSDGILNLLKLQPANKKIMSAQELLNSRREYFNVGKIL